MSSSDFFSWFEMGGLTRLIVSIRSPVKFVDSSNMDSEKSIVSSAISRNSFVEKYRFILHPMSNDMAHGISETWAFFK